VNFPILPALRLAYAVVTAKTPRRLADSRGVTWRRLFTSLLLLLLLNSAVNASVPPTWKDTSFMINANGMSLRKVLDEFGNTYGVRVAIAIKDDVRVKGTLKADNGVEFLDRLGATQGFSWFVYNDTLHIATRNDNISARLEVGEDAVQDAKAALIGLGLFDKRFGWGELPDEGVVIVSGPREYVELARGILLPELRRIPAKGRQVMVFRLKYANATDRTITTRGQKEVIPGIKSILNGLLNPSGPDKIGSPRDRFDAASERRSRSPQSGKADFADDGKYPPLPPPTANMRDFGKYANTESGKLLREQQPAAVDDMTGRTDRNKSTRDEHPQIDADPNLNAIIIYDHVSKRDMYKALIADLDIEPQQIEIEALIVDIDRSKMAELGVEWSVRAGTTSATINATAAESLGINLPLPGSTLLINNLGRFYARLRAMEGTGDARVLARPTVLTLDNMAAVLDLSQTAYISLVGERVADLANVTAGTSLRVVPRILKEGTETRVRLEIDIEDGSIKDPTLKDAVTRSTISTQAIVDMQQTLIIGGYHSESLSSNRQKVPILGDLPLIGGIFRSSNEGVRERERLFLITPRLSGRGNLLAKAHSRVTQLARNEAITENLASERSAEPKDAPPTGLAPQYVAPTAGNAPGSSRRVTCARPKSPFIN